MFIKQKYKNMYFMYTHYMRGFGRQIPTYAKLKNKPSNINVSINRTRTLIPSSFVFYI